MEICRVEGDGNKVRTDLVLMSPTCAGGEHYVEVIPPSLSRTLPPRARPNLSELRRAGREVQGRRGLPPHSQNKDAEMQNHRPLLTVSEGTTKTNRLPFWLPRRRNSGTNEHVFEIPPPLEFVMIPTADSSPVRDDNVPRPPLSPASHQELQVDQNLNLLPPPPLALQRNECVDLAPIEVVRVTRPKITTIDNSWKTCKTIKSLDSNPSIYSLDSMILSEDSMILSEGSIIFSDGTDEECNSRCFSDQSSNSPMEEEEEEKEGLTGVQFLNPFV